MMFHANDGLVGLAVGWAVWINIDGRKVVWLCIFLHLHSRDVDPLPVGTGQNLRRGKRRKRLAQHKNYIFAGAAFLSGSKRQTVLDCLHWARLFQGEFLGVDEGIKDASGFYCKSNKFALFYVGNICIVDYAETLFAEFCFCKSKKIRGSTSPSRPSSLPEEFRIRFRSICHMSWARHIHSWWRPAETGSRGSFKTISLFVSDPETVKSCSDLSTSNLECLECSEGSDLGILMQLVVSKRMKNKAPVGECLRLLRAVGPDVRCQLWARNWSDRRFCFLIACK